MNRMMDHHGHPVVATFSIIAFDEKEQEWGVAVQSKFLAAGALVPWAMAETGALATQSFANTSFGPRGLRMLADGKEPEAVLWDLLADDPERQLRQVGIVDAKGRSATFTGSSCLSWAGGIAEPGFACQGNVLAGEGVIEGMADYFRASSNDSPLAERLVRALEVGQEAGGDKRGMQSASLLVVKKDGGFGGWNDRMIDLRVDEHHRPIAELKRILSLHRLYFQRSKPEDFLPLKGDHLEEVKDLLRQAGYTPGAGEEYDGKTREALKTFYLRENFDDRWKNEPVVDRRVLEYMRHFQEEQGKKPAFDQ
ncbi:Uncharacterized conserved protein, Ntn-hydrolase superfamily [Marininema mesophilum]|uniref:Uncharacterized conserved protein, Ntn-hydrolase superfamily n=1 Tax=Marininema mesophilum TaxID=1048340 RepID=A0A1H3CF49_9BACL|nr:DUF1028 domain-containing protein [Marininema mesophilum]SDX52528.1 Uncharacterized conserved protein, Ntn-hydrolase superfamily [Marininema mesophilum]